MKPAHAMINCPLSCGQPMLLGEVERHTRERCPCRLVVCQSCQEELKCRDLPLISHKETTCPNCETYCRFAQLGCDQPMIRRELDRHHSTNADKHQNLMLAAVYRANGVPNVTRPNGGSDGVTGNRAGDMKRREIDGHHSTNAYKYRTLMLAALSRANDVLDVTLPSRGWAGDASLSSRETDKTVLELPLELRRRLKGDGTGRNVGEGDFGVTAEGLFGPVIDMLYVLGCKVDTLIDGQHTLSDGQDTLIDGQDTGRDDTLIDIVIDKVDTLADRVDSLTKKLDKLMDKLDG